MKILYLLLLVAAIIGIVGSAGYLFYYHQYPIAVCQCVVGYLMYPVIKGIIKKLQD